MVFLVDIFHWVVDRVLRIVSLAQNQEYGWKSIDRKTGRIIREQQPLLKKLRLLLLFNPMTEWLDTTQAMRVHMHKKSEKEGRVEATSASREKIRSFIDTYNINMADFTPSDPSKYANFEEFFVRHHAQGSRPIHEPEDKSLAVVVADSRVVVYDTVSETKKLWIKGSNFDLTNLVMDKVIGSHFGNGAIASFRLSPQDYHRYHSPVTGTVKLFRAMPGDYYQVDPVALHSTVDILTRNTREYVVIETEEFGDVLFVAIGATDVGTVSIYDRYQKPGIQVRKGDEIGLFQFGGSSIIVAFEEDRIKFDHDLRAMSQQSIQTSVDVGMSLGKVAAKG
ncbi:phosphatidylserine decarboxylase [Diaporthe sp. PMI_573]|nr:phosphatidylserine decarboxylase [Diaporthaceae sp. PMI_573]